jgi:two-component system, NarL family, sensor kinase
MHDDIGSGLSQIAYLVQSANNISDNTSLQHTLLKTKTTSNELVDKMNEIIWGLNNKDKSLDDLLAYMRHNYAELLTQSNMKYKITMPEVIAQTNLNALLKRNIYLIGKETVHNAIKHSEASTISITVQLPQSNTLVLTIADDGCGITPAHTTNGQKLKGGNGLININKRLQEINGVQSVTTNNTGTTFTYTFLLQ